ncbi:hypothetical protein PTKIN_Ptkin04bG0143500 [Pterospermum kingtungense]
MSALYRDYRHKLKKKYSNLKSSYQPRLKNKPPHVDADDWKCLVNHWHEATFQDKSNKFKTSRAKSSMPAYTGTKSYARLREQLKKENGKAPSRVEIFIKSRKRKKGKELEPLSQHVVSLFEHLKKQREEGGIMLDDEGIFAKVLGTEKNGYVRAYGPGKSFTAHFGATPSKVDLLK